MRKATSSGDIDVRPALCPESGATCEGSAAFDAFLWKASGIQYSTLEMILGENRFGPPDAVWDISEPTRKRDHRLVEKSVFLEGTTSTQGASAFVLERDPSDRMQEVDVYPTVHINTSSSLVFTGCTSARPHEGLVSQAPGSSAG
ncbi:hypothetical protein TSMEX_006974 [Taenia solium]|eukprot:TsM_000556600 transcript=TsM_000556600 gene=TsM_000556600